MSKILIPTMLLAVFLCGCQANGVKYFENKNDAECTIQCNELIKDRWCEQGTATFGNMCRCVMLSCIKNVTIQDEPKDFKGYTIDSSVFTSSNQECFKNGVEIEC